MGAHSSAHRLHKSTVRDALAYGSLWKTERARGTKGVEARIPTLSSDTKLDEALELMGDAGVQACPVKLGGSAELAVRRGTLKHTRSSEPLAHLPLDFVGYFDLRDMLELLFLPFSNNAELRALATRAHKGEAEALSALLAKADEVLAQPVSLITGRNRAAEAGRAKRMLVAALDTPLLDVLENMAETHYHRVLVVTCTDDHAASIETDDVRGRGVHQDDILALLTPMHVLGWVGRHARDERSCEELRLGLRTVHTIGADEPLVDGLTMLVDKNVSALAVLDDSGSVQSALSAGMLRGFTRDRFPELGMTCGEFARQESWFAPIVVRADTEPFAAIVDRLLAARAHHAWLVNDRNKPVGILTLADVVARLHLSAGRHASPSGAAGSLPQLQFIDAPATTLPDHKDLPDDHHHVGLPQDTKKKGKKKKAAAAGSATASASAARLKTVYEG